MLSNRKLYAYVGPCVFHEMSEAIIVSQIVNALDLKILCKICKHYFSCNYYITGERMKSVIFGDHRIDEEH